jgi:hypothetical protein
VTVTPVRSDVGSSVPGFLLSKTFVVVWSFAFALFFFGFATKWTFDPSTIGSYWPGRFFSAQADAMLNGRLWIDKTYLPGECFFSDGKCYGYFGITPSLIRIPMVPVLGIEGSEMTALFLAVAAGIALWAALDLCRRVLLRTTPVVNAHSAGFMAVAAVVLGPGGALMVVSDAYVYEEAILWAVAAMAVATNLFWRWWTQRRDRQFVGATIAVVVAASSRPTAALVGLVLAAGVVIVGVRARRISWKLVLGSLGLAALPLIALFGSFFLKFGSPTPPEAGYEGLNYVNVQKIMANNDGSFSISARFVPTGAMAYLRPDSVSVSADWPWVRIRFGPPSGGGALERITYLPPLNQDSMNVEPIVSITNIMPLPFVATVMAAIAIVMRRRRRFELLILLALCTPLPVVLTNPTIASRYLGDFFPLLAAGTAFAAMFVPWFARLSRRWRYVISSGVIVLALASVPIAMVLATQYNWTYRLGIQ